MEGLEPLADVSAGDWIAEAASDPASRFGTVASVVPRGFDRYALVPHPVDDEEDAQVGSLAPAALRPLIDVLAPVTGSQHCYHALWEGWGWVDGTGVAIFTATEDGRVVPAAQPVPGVPPEVWALPRLRLPGRDYLLFRGPLEAALNMGWHGSPLGFEPQSPSLLWPADRSWCVGTEIDLEFTFVAGSAAMIHAVLAAPGLDARPVAPDDKLSQLG